MSNELHDHNYRGVTTFSDGHVHQYTGRTSTNPDSIGHIHTIRGVTTFNDGHVHHYTTITSKAIYFNEDEHYHYYRGETTVVDGHDHLFAGNTSVYTDND